MEQLTSDVFYVAGGVLGAVVWFVRLEAKVMYLEKDHDEHKRKSSEKEARMWTKIEDLQISINLIMQTLARIETKLESKGE